MRIRNCHKRFIPFAALLTLSGTVFPQNTIPALRASLENATSVKARADICFNIASSYALLLKIDSALYFAGKTKDYSQQGNYETGIGKYHLAFADALFYRNRNEEAEENLLQAIRIFTRQKEIVLLGRAYLILANSRYVTNKISLARMNYWKAIAVFESIRDGKGLYAAYLWMARGYFKTSEVDSASVYSIKALSVAEQLKEAEKIFIAGCTVGRSFLSLGEWEKAVKYFEQGLKYQAPRTDKVALRGYLRDYAISLISTHEFSKADSVIKEVELVNEMLKDGYGISVINRLRGAMEYERQNYGQAVIYLGQASDKMHALQVSNSETKDIELLLGRAAYETHNYDDAVYHLKSAVSMSREFRALTDEEEANLLISKSFQQKGEADSALVYFKSYTELKDSIVSQQKQKTIIEVTTRYETEKKEQLIRMLEKEKEADSYVLELKNQQLEKQKLEGEKKSQQLMLLSQQSEISRLEALQKTLALESQEKEMLKKQKELEMVSQESRLKAAIATKETQRKNIAYIAAMAVLLFGGIAFFRYRQSRKLGRQLAASLMSLKEAQDQLIRTEKEKEAENVRARISRDIHDEVGATLSGVALFSEIAKQKMEQRQEQDARVYLNHISANSKEMVDKMSDIVWAINPDNDSFEHIISKIQSYAINLCAGKGIGLHLRIDEVIRKDHPSMQVKRDLYLFMKEAVNNAAKYSGASNIHLSLQARGDSCLVEIRDDGKGFDASLDYLGNGLRNMKERARSLGAGFALDSSPGQGTCIGLQFEFHPERGQSQKA